MAKAKVPTPKSAPSDPAADPGLVKKPTRKKKKFWKSKARDVRKKPTSDPRVELRPPKAPEDFSQNWKALQEVRAGLSSFSGPPRPEHRSKTRGVRKADWSRTL